MRKGGAMVGVIEIRTGAAVVVSLVVIMQKVWIMM